MKIGACVRKNDYFKGKIRVNFIISLQKQSKACKPGYLAAYRLLRIMAKLANHGIRQHNYPMKSSTNGSTGICISDAEPCHFLLYFVNAYMGIIVECHADIGMPHHIL